MRHRRLKGEITAIDNEMIIQTSRFANVYSQMKLSYISSFY